MLENQIQDPIVQEEPRSGLYYVVPAFVFESDDIGWPEKMLYALISGLSTNHGYCFASDSYLAKKMKVDDRTIRRHLNTLESLKFITKHTEKKGMFWSRKIYVNSWNSNNFYEGTSVSYPIGQKCPTRTDKNVRIVSKDNIVSEVIESRGCGGEAPPAPIPPTPPPQKIEEKFFEKDEIKMPQKKYEALLDRFSKEEVEYNVEMLSLYAKASPKKFVKYKDHAAVIAQWILKDRKQKEERSQWATSKGYYTQKRNSRGMQSYDSRNDSSDKLQNSRKDSSEGGTSGQGYRTFNLIAMMEEEDERQRLCNTSGSQKDSSS